MGLHYDDQRTHPGPVIILNVCELCGHSFESQYTFFKHLKEHYEPEFVAGSSGAHVPEPPIPDDGDSDYGKDDNDGFVNEQFEEIFANNINNLEIFIKHQESRAENYQIDGMMMIEDPGPVNEMDHNVVSGSGGNNMEGLRSPQGPHEMLDDHHDPQHHYHPHSHHHLHHHHHHHSHHQQQPLHDSEGNRKQERQEMERLPSEQQSYPPLPDPVEVDEVLRPTTAIPPTTPQREEILPPSPTPPHLFSPESPPPPSPPPPSRLEKTREKSPELAFTEELCAAVRKPSNRKTRKPKRAKTTYPCDKCIRVFDSLAALKYHLTVHESRQLKCEHCDKMFRTKSTLRVHLRIHLDKRPFGCDQCELRFRQKNDLSYHIASKHTESKDYKFECEFCNKKFARKYSLNLHTKVHTGKKDHQCELCPKAFRASSYLDVHRRSHLAYRPFACPLCKKAFGIKADMRRHLEQVHKRSKAAVTKLLEKKVIVVVD